MQLKGGLLDGVILDLDQKKDSKYFSGNHEPYLQQAIKDFVHPGMVVYDIGANIGYTTLAFARCLDKRGHIYAFEPFFINLERLMKHININNEDSMTTIVPNAVSDRNETAIFRIGRHHAIGHLADADIQDYDIASIKVRCVSLDNFIFVKGNSVPNVVKIDIEGGEEKALYGMQRLLREKRPVLFLEIHSDKSTESVSKVLNGNLYKIYELAEGYKEIENIIFSSNRIHILALPKEIGFEGNIKKRRSNI